MKFIFYTAGSFSLSRIDNARIADNTNPDGDEFIGFFATAGGGYEIRNSLFQNNQSVSYALIINNDSDDSDIVVEDTNFIGNSGNPETINGSLLRTQSGEAVLRRIQIDDNSDFTVSIVATGGSTVDFETVCWLGGNTNEYIALFAAGSDSTSFTAAENFVAANEETTQCNEVGFRINTNDMGCVAGADTAAMCSLTLAPTLAPTSGKKSSKKSKKSKKDSTTDASSSSTGKSTKKGKTGKKASKKSKKPKKDSTTDASSSSTGKSTKKGKTDASTSSTGKGTKKGRRENAFGNIERRARILGTTLVLHK